MDGVTVTLLQNQLPFLLRFVATIGFAVALVSAAEAAEIRLMSSGGMKVALIDLIPAFERATNHKVAAIYGAPGAIRDRILSGEAMDVLVFPGSGLDALAEQGKIIPHSKVILARSGIGVAVRAGAPKPNISTAEDLKRALLAAKSIVYTNPVLGSPSGVHFAKVLKLLGIAEEMKSKSKLHDGTSFNAELVAKGEAEIAIQQISEILSVKGVELAGALPADLQLTTVFAIGLGAAAKQHDAAEQFIKFLRSPAAAAVIKATGMEPGSS
jgi:molybdate transport system substrate-binding protein